jgi:type I restriction enzyme, R subunit
MNKTSNFEFLNEYDPIYFQLTSTAEKAFANDPNTTLIKLRQFGEVLARDLATRFHLTFDERISQVDLLYQINREVRLDPTIRNLFHTLRIEGNKATHAFHTDHQEALKGLQIAHTLAVWYHKACGKEGPDFKADPFIPPTDPSQTLRELQTQIALLKTELQETQSQQESHQDLSLMLSQEKKNYQYLSEQMAEHTRQHQEAIQAQEALLKQQQAEFDAKLKALQIQTQSAQKGAEQTEEETLERKVAKQKTQTLNQRIQQANSQLQMNEELTRILIDQQLRDAGWLADTQELSYAKGARPEKGKNLAIAEWPTQGQQKADYVLFAGLTPIAVVEAKRENTNVAGKITQAERYAAGFRPSQKMIPAWQAEGRTIAWPLGERSHYQIPFVYSSNGRPFIQQLAEQSGTWFRDVRQSANLARALHEFHSPAGLLDKLKRSQSEAQEKLQKEGFAYLKLRDYQLNAIQAVESALKDNQQTCLLAMATGTGKTRTIIGLMYRLLKAERFKRILFLVDRNALGQQAQDVFKEAPLEQSQPLSKIYNIAELGDMAAEAETRIQVATVQAMVKRVFQSETSPPIDTYDCLIVDEAHRGYTLDQEMTEGEMATRDQAQYLSSYRRVLDYFDAVKIGLTATPAKHTTDIFGKPVFTYSYREAVADDWLIDHEPPIRYETLLTQKGIHFEKGVQVHVVNTRTGEVSLADLDDEINFDVESFNKRVITESFNRVICEQLAQELDPFGNEKTLIFCATDLHADMVKRLLDQAFQDLYAESYNEAAVRKITGQSDKVDQLIRQYKHERNPRIALTVDLLTTGIDVPPICHLVFLRRVRSRILYEQMIGRATRRCDEIGKTAFKIYDPVDIYAALQEVSTMQPLVKDPNISLGQLVAELTQPESLERALKLPGAAAGQTHADDVLDMLSQKVMRVLRKAVNKAEKLPDIQALLNEMEQLYQVPPAKLHQHLHAQGPQQTSAFLHQHANFLQKLESLSQALGSNQYPLISDHHDQLMAREQSYGAFQRPDDYLDSFESFIRTHLNESVALSVVVNRPRDLTRAQLREIKILLDQYNYSETSLQTAWRNKTQQDIAASIVGFIRSAALGCALLPFAQRVERAMGKIYALHTWTPIQRKWLERLAKQLTFEVVMDEAFINKTFAQDGGAKIMNRRLDDKLNQVMETLAESLWLDVG